MAGNGLEKTKSQRATDPLSKKQTEKNVSLDAYLRNSLHDLENSSRAEANSVFTDGYGADPDYPHDERQSRQAFDDQWVRSFQTDLTAGKSSKNLSRSILPYVAIAIVCGAVSGGGFLYFLLQYSTPPTEVTSVTEAAPEIADAEAPSSASTPRSPQPSPKASIAQPPGAESQNVRHESLSAASNGNDANPAVAPTFFSAVDANPTNAAPPSPAPVPSMTEAPAARAAETGMVKPEAEAQHAKLSPDQEDKMLKKGSTLVAQNDISGARLVFHYLATHGSAKGAFALAESYDARKLAGRHVAGITPDANLARTWYARAAELGSKEAAAILRKP